MSAVGILVVVAFGLVVIQHVILCLGVVDRDSEGGFMLSGVIGVPVGLVVTAAFVVALAQAC